MADKELHRNPTRGKEVDHEAKRCKVVAETDTTKIKAEGELMMVELYPDKSGFKTRISAKQETQLTEQLIAALRRNVDIFAFSPKDMTGIPPEVAMHHLNVDPKAKSVKQKLRIFLLEKDAITKEEVQKLLKAGHVRKIQSPL